MNVEPCSEYVDIGPFRFECRGHLPGEHRSARLYFNGRLRHDSPQSPREDGDVEVTWWTAALHPQEQSDE